MIKMLKSIIHPFKTIKRMGGDEKQTGIDELINRRIYIANDMIFILLSIINIVLLALGVHKISELCHKYLL